VQFARSVGAHITGVCGTANVGYVRSIGADEVVDYKKADWRRLGKAFDVIFDAAGASTFALARRYLSPTGFYINTAPKPSMFLTSQIVGLTSRQHSVPFMLKTDAASLRELARLAEQKVLQPHIAKTIRLEDVASAQRQMQGGKIHGKICVRISE
jgi:NADPH:quinone reductase-like Zn-dependent oxidoreductase